MRIALGSLAFFLSGFAALIYQVVWQRMLVLPIAADVYSTTVIVGAFMAGLGCGSLAGGHVADRLTRTQCLRLFVGAELCVAVFGAASRYIFYDWMYLGLGGLSLTPLATAIVVFAALIWPTFWMGMSLPLLARAVTSTVDGAATRIGVLYGLNTLGAAVGAFATTWVLFPSAGLAGSLWVAVALNVLAAIAALLLTGRGPSSARAVVARQSAVTVVDVPRWSFRAWALLYGIAGFQALSLEIVWFRLLGVMVKSSAFTFGTLLAIYLAGLGLGAAIGSATLRGVRRPAFWFLLLQAFVALYAGAAILVLTASGDTPPLSPLLAYFASYEPFHAGAAAASFWTGGGDPAARAQFVRLYLVLPAILIGPPTIAMGASFPLIQRIVVHDVAHLGRRVGTVMLANIAGSTLGAILTGWVALTYAGSAGSLRILTLVGSLFLWLAIASLRRSGPVKWTAAFAIPGVVLAVALPGQSQLWARLHGTVPQRLVVAEDASGVAVLKVEGPVAVVFVNGIGQSWIPYGNIHTVLGALPAFVHPQPRDAALIGLGSGDTVYAAAGRADLTSITCVEIIRPQLTTLQEWRRRTEYGGLVSLLSDSRVTQIAGDGRAYLMNAGRTFDIIEADALRPTSAYSGNLYSTGYFELVRSRLSPGGLAVSWAPTPRVLDTFLHVFPHALGFGDIVIGSNEPIRFDAAAIKARLAEPAVQEYYFRAGVNINALLARYVDTPPQVLRGGNVALPGALNEDLFPRDEFGVPLPVTGNR